MECTLETIVSIMQESEYHPSIARQKFMQLIDQSLE